MPNGNFISFPVRFTGKNENKTIDMNGVDLFEVWKEKLYRLAFSEDQTFEDTFWA